MATGVGTYNGAGVNVVWSRDIRVRHKHNPRVIIWKYTKNFILKNEFQNLYK